MPTKPREPPRPRSPARPKSRPQPPPKMELPAKRESWFGRRTPRPHLPEEARIGWHRAGATALKATAIGGGGLALAYGGGQLIQAGGKALNEALRGHEKTLEDVQKTTPEGTYTLGEDGSTHFTPSADYLGQLADLGYGPGGAPLPVGLEQAPKQNDTKEAFGEFIDKVTSPVTILVLAAGIALVIYFRNASKGKKGGSK